MRAHKRLLHSGKNLGCELCDYRTYSSFNLRLHLSKMHNAPSLKAVCPVCDIKTHSIDWHIRVFHPVYFDEQQQKQVDTASVVVVDDDVSPEVLSDQNTGTAVVTIHMD